MLPHLCKNCPEGIKCTERRTGTDMNDLECGITIMELKHDYLKELSILHPVKDMCVPCSHHADAIMMFAELYGGHECSHLRFDDSAS